MKQKFQAEYHCMKTVILLSLILITLFSCNSRAEKITSCQGYNSNTIPAKIYKGGKNIVNNYLYGYGAERQERFFARGYASDSLFLLPLNINKDLSKFCFVRKDLTIDTIEISSSRSFEMSLDQKCYMFHLNGVLLKTLSSGFIKDSSYVDNQKTSTGSIISTSLVLTIQ